MKVCTGCEVEKDESAFYKNKNMRDGYQHQCKECMNALNTASRNKKKEHYYLIQKQRERANLARFNEWKQEQGCALCDENDPCCLDMHHTSSDKEFAVSDKVRHYGWDTLFEEVQKCIVVCRNCHAKIHAGKL